MAPLTAACIVFAAICAISECKSVCPEGNVPCPLNDGTISCCNEGYFCGSNGTCLQWNDASNVICPDGQSQCPAGNTCCKLSSGQWGCCPLPNAVCCSNGENCCPSGYTCDVSAGTCTKGDIAIAMIEKKPAALREENVVCPGGQYQCPTGNTCCKLSSGEYGCCPLPNAVCCSNGENCCPSGYTCDLSAGTCTKGDIAIAMIEKKPAALREENVVCPGGQYQCPTGNTCCKLSSGEYGCCPLPNAVCCSNGENCCPSGYTCDLSAGTCTKGDIAIAMIEKKPAALREENVVCPDGQSQCPAGNTCCKLSSGQWGCCPLPNAVCCSNGENCCPSGYTCDVSAGTCTKGDIAIAMIEKKPAALREENVVCPGGQYQCPTGNTCCKLSSGEYGCCPLPNAVCCSNGENCCPSGYTCDLSAGTCTKGDIAIAMIEKRPAALREGDVTCPDGQSQCPAGNTCCKLSSGQWGCCPIPNAVCCSDGEHCCPSGYTCDVSAGTCTKGDIAIAMIEKKPAALIEENVVCPDGQSQCPAGNTCCKLSSGQWGCCPLPNAVCCSNGENCCPSGYTCDVSAGTCTKGDIAIAMIEKTPAALREGDVTCPDGQSECPTGNTCCKLSSGQWGCCPIPNAVCCSDGKHCCPSGYTCDVSAGTCTEGDTVIAMIEKRPAALREGDVTCPDGQSECPTGNTCCKLSSGQWGCCPLPNAVCCSNGENCCPSGYTCDVSAGTCTKGDIAIAMIGKRPAALREGIVVCGGGYYCPDGTTCCQLLSGQWGCCPIPNAVCCSDGKYCCPSGHTCTSSGCQQGDVIVAMIRKIPALVREQGMKMEKTAAAKERDEYVRLKDQI